MAVHILEEAQRCLNCKVPQCQKGCPIHTPIPKVIRLMLDGKLDEAGWMLFENNPLTTVCSQIGRASCGKECRSRWSPYH